MSEPFPSKEYIQLCIKNQEVLREEWEPKFGDFCYGTDRDIIRSTVGLKPEGRVWVVVDSWEGESGGVGVRVWAPTRHHPAVSRDKLTWLPRLGQLIEMLEERGYEWFVRSVGFYKNRDICIVRVWPSKDHGPDNVVCSEGPDPATALLKAYLSLDPVGEVVKGGD